MAHEATNWAYKLDLPMTQKFILVALADRADEEFSCYPGQKLLAKMTGSSVATVRRALKELESSGLISRKQRRRDDGYRTSDRYFLNVGISPLKLTDDVIEDDSHRSESSTSPLTQSTLTAHSGGDIEPPVNDKRTTSGQKAAPRATAKRATQIDSEFTPTPQMLEWARTEAPLVDAQFESRQFVDHHMAKGSLMKDWGRAWQTWMRNSQKWTAQKNPQAAGGFNPNDWMNK